MTRMKVVIIPFYVVLALTGCSSFQPVSGYEIVPVVDRGSDLNSRLEELHACRGTPPVQLEAVLASRERDFQDNPSFNNRMNLALLLAAGDKAIQDHARALKLLEGIDSTPVNAGEQELVIILKQFIEAQIATTSKNDILAKQLTEQEKQIEELKQQLKDLTTIEQSIQRRDKAVEAGDVQ
jgi:hypothetical protein